MYKMPDLEMSKEIILKNVRKIEAKIELSNITPKPEMMAVIKYAKDEDIFYCAQSGIKIMGENRLQDAIKRWSKAEFMDIRPSIDLHFIGRIQSNKAAKIASFFDSVDSIDSFLIAEELDKSAKKLGKKIPTMIQLKINDRGTQGGVDPGEFSKLFKQIKDLKNISLRGIMAIGPITEDKSEIGKAFSLAKKVYDSYFHSEINEDGHKNFLSMGMSSDYEQAISNGATMLRIGSLIFQKQTGEK